MATSLRRETAALYPKLPLAKLLWGSLCALAVCLLTSQSTAGAILHLLFVSGIMWRIPQKPSKYLLIVKRKIILIILIVGGNFMTLNCSCSGWISSTSCSIRTMIGPREWWVLSSEHFKSHDTLHFNSVPYHELKSLTKHSETGAFHPPVLQTGVPRSSRSEMGPCSPLHSTDHMGVQMAAHIYFILTCFQIFNI